MHVKSSGPKVSIAGRYEEKDKNVTPGPKYDPIISSKGSLKFTIKGKPKDTVKKDVPGPGAYDFDSLHPSKSAITFGASQRKFMIELPEKSFPGPGAYYYPGIPIKERREPKYSYNVHSKGRFGRSKEKEMMASTMPGPGAYDAKPIIGNEGIRHSISSRMTEAAPTKSLVLPGPGTYDPGIIKYKAPAYKLGAAKRTKDKSIQDDIGPGSHEPNYKITETSLPKWK